MSTTPRELRKKLPPPLVSIRLLREAHGMTIPMLVARIADEGVNVTADHISNCELGWKRPGPPLLLAWTRALGIIQPDVLFYPDLPSSAQAAA